MAISEVETLANGDNAAASALDQDFAIAPANGTHIICAGACYFPDSIGTISFSNPTSLTTHQNQDASGNLAAMLYGKDAGVSEVTAVDWDKTGDIEALAAVAINVSGSTGHDVSGKATTNSATSLTVTADGNTTSDSSRAYLIIFGQQAASYAPNTPSGWTLLAEEYTTTASRVGVHVYKKDVDSGSAVSVTWTRSGTASRIKGFLYVVGPSNVAPTVTAPATDDCVVGVNENIGSVFTVADSNSNLSTIRYQCVEAHGDITVTLSGGVTVSAGTNGTHDFTITGSHAALLTVHATAVFNATTEDTQNITVTATDTEALSANDTVSMVSHYARITGATEDGLDTTMGTTIAVISQGGTYPLDFIVEDSGGRRGTLTINVEASEAVLTLFKLLKKRRRLWS